MTAENAGQARLLEKFHTKLLKLFLRFEHIIAALLLNDFLRSVRVWKQENKNRIY